MDIPEKNKIKLTLKRIKVLEYCRDVHKKDCSRPASVSVFTFLEKKCYIQWRGYKGMNNPDWRDCWFLTSWGEQILKELENKQP